MGGNTDKSLATANVRLLKMLFVSCYAHKYITKEEIAIDKFSKLKHIMVYVNPYLIIKFGIASDLQVRNPE